MIASIVCKRGELSSTVIDFRVFVPRLAASVLKTMRLSPRSPRASSTLIAPSLVLPVGYCSLKSRLMDRPDPTFVVAMFECSEERGTRETRNFCKISSEFLVGGGGQCLLLWGTIEGQRFFGLFIRSSHHGLPVHKFADYKSAAAQSGGEVVGEVCSVKIWAFRCAGRWWAISREEKQLTPDLPNS